LGDHCFRYGRFEVCIIKSIVVLENPMDTVKSVIGAVQEHVKGQLSTVLDKAVSVLQSTTIEKKPEKDEISIESILSQKEPFGNEPAPPPASTADLQKMANEFLAGHSDNEGLTIVGLVIQFKDFKDRGKFIEVITLAKTILQGKSEDLQSDIDKLGNMLLDAKTTNLTILGNMLIDGNDRSFSFSRILKNIRNMIGVSIFPLLCVLMASFISNEMIMYSPWIRAIFFAFIFYICLVFKVPVMVIGSYYVLRYLHGKFVNNFTERPKVKVWPTIYSVLPLLIERPLQPLMAFFAYPFMYPKTHLDRVLLDKEMQMYEKSLRKSFPYGDVMMESEEYKRKAELADEFLDHMHDPPKKSGSSAPETVEPATFYAPIGTNQMK